MDIQYNLTYHCTKSLCAARSAYTGYYKAKVNKYHRMDKHFNTRWTCVHLIGNKNKTLESDNLVPSGSTKKFRLKLTMMTGDDTLFIGLRFCHLFKINIGNLKP